MLTRRQRECFDFVDAYTRLHGEPPTYAEIAAGIGAASRSQIHTLVGQLEARGFVRYTPAKRRSIEIIKRPEPFPDRQRQHPHGGVSDVNEPDLVAGEG